MRSRRICAAMSAFSMQSCREVGQQGQRRPSPLLLQKTSHAIKKSPPRKPVVIHVVAPKVIHVPPGEFMSLVQRLTGGGPSSSHPPPPATTTTEGKTAGRVNGELLGRGPPVSVEAVWAPSRQVLTTETPAEPTHPSDRPSPWYDFFMDQSQRPSASFSVSVSSSGHVLPSPGSCVDASCRALKQTLTRWR